MLVLIHPQSTLAADELPDSSRIIGALRHGLQAVCGQADLDAFVARSSAGEPPVLATGGFPWVIVNGSRTLFLPAPVGAAVPEAARYVSRGLATRLLAANTAPTANELLVVGGRAMLREEAKRAVFESRVVESARKGASASATALGWADELRALRRPAALSVRRRAVSAENTLHGRTEIAFGAASGWWFELHLRDESWAERFRSAIRWVCDAGWGADRSIGKGVATARFEPSSVPISAPSAPGSRRLLLSRWLPSAAESARFKDVSTGCRLVRRPAGQASESDLVYVSEGSLVPADAVGECRDSSRDWGFAYISQITGPTAPQN